MNNIANCSQPIMNKSFKKWLTIILLLCVFEALLFYLVFHFNWIPLLILLNDGLVHLVSFCKKHENLALFLFFFFVVTFWTLLTMGREAIIFMLVFFIPAWSIVLLLTIRFW